MKKSSTLIVMVSLLLTLSVYGQTGMKQDTARAGVSLHNRDSTAFENDTVTLQNVDVSPLDIDGSRGIFILSADRMLQLRILGSIRASFNYTGQDLENHQTFNPFEIPTVVNNKSPNYFAGLQQTRLGVEVTRRTKKRGDIFIRFEGDFNNSSNTLRIRHAYGQFGRLLVGQTWSLMSNISYQPALVSLDGPATGSGLRTPQIRYSYKMGKKMSLSAAIEYSAPELDLPDSANVAILQVMPNVSGRYSYISKKLSFRVAAVLSTISGRIDEGEINYAFGYAGSFAGRLKLPKKSEIFLGLFAGKATAHFIDIYNGKNQDIAFDPLTTQFGALNAYGGYLAYEKLLPKNLSTNLSFGISSISNVDFQPDDAYNYSYNALFNFFWQPVEGARLGIEFANGQRFDKGSFRGMTNRLSALIYYDF